MVSAKGEATVDGSCEGVIVEAPRGKNGFGYDPLFSPLATPDRTCGELSAAEKDALSHRGAAMRRLEELLK
jgi:XTP/dITP diphosphohydrolase